MTTLDDEWAKFIKQCNNDDPDTELTTNFDPISEDMLLPEPSPMYISTKSKIAYFTQPIDLSIFWNIPVMPYSTMANGVIKKQIKMNSTSKEQLEDIQSRLRLEKYYDEHVISHIDNPLGRIKFKDIRKISIGLSKKDLLLNRCKQKQAFYNCFVMILRLKESTGVFKEFHIKIFNTGKLEIPGVQTDAGFQLVLDNIQQILQPFCKDPLIYSDKMDTVLINSNFNCQFYIDREVLFNILKFKYGIQSIYDPCSYPGIQCKFYYNKDADVQTGIQPTEPSTNIISVSFMIFRTGNVLIVGMCDEFILDQIYNFLTQLLKNEFKYICTQTDLIPVKCKVQKIRKRMITVTN